MYGAVHLVNCVEHEFQQDGFKYIIKLDLIVLVVGVWPDFWINEFAIRTIFCPSPVFNSHCVHSCCMWLLISISTMRRTWIKIKLNSDIWASCMKQKLNVQMKWADKLWNMPFLRVECLQTCNLAGGVLKSQCLASRCKSLILSEYPTSKTNVELLYFLFFEQLSLRAGASTAGCSEIISINGLQPHWALTSYIGDMEKLNKR